MFWRAKGEEGGLLKHLKSIGWWRSLRRSTSTMTAAYDWSRHVPCLHIITTTWHFHRIIIIGNWEPLIGQKTRGLTNKIWRVWGVCQSIFILETRYCRIVDLHRSMKLTIWMHMHQWQSWCLRILFAIVAVDHCVYITEKTGIIIVVWTDDLVIWEGNREGGENQGRIEGRVQNEGSQRTSIISRRSSHSATSSSYPYFIGKLC